MKMRNYILVYILFFTSLSSYSQQWFPSEYDLLLFCGGSLNYVNSPEINSKITSSELSVGAEFLLFQHASVGMSLENEFYRFFIKSNSRDSYSETDLYWCFNVNLYSTKFYYLKGEFIYHLNPNESWAYPRSFREHGYAFGIGKKVFIKGFIVIDFGGSLQYFTAKWMDAQAQQIYKRKIQISLYTGFKILLKTKQQKQ